MDAAEESLEIENTQVEEDQEGGEDHADVADGVHDEGLARRQHGRAALEPETDQQVGTEADHGPADDQPDEVAGEDEQQHREDEEVHVGEEARDAGILPHVADRVDMDEEADPGDHQDHQGGQRIDIEVEGNVEVAALPPGEVGLVELLAAQHLRQDHQGEDEGQSDAARADPSDYPAGQQPAEQGVDEKPRERRQKDQRREDVHRSYSFIRSSSSTSIWRPVR